MEKPNLSKVFKVIAATLLFISAVVQLSVAEDSATKPAGYSTKYYTSGNQMLSPLRAPTTTTYDVLLIEDVAPWNSTSNEVLLNNNGLSYKKIGIADANSEDFKNFRKIILAGDQLSAFYNSYMAIRTKFDNYVANGGMIEWHACGFGWNNGDSSGIVLPGDITMNGFAYYLNFNFVEMPAHPLVTGVTSPFWGSLASHAYFTNFAGLSGINIITTEGDTEGDGPTLIQYPFGRGCVVASSQPLEYGYTNGQVTGTILTNMISHFCSRGFTGDVSLTVSEDPQDAGHIYGYIQSDYTKNLIDCGRACSTRFNQGTQVTIEAIPNGKFTFSYWDYNGICNINNPLSLWVSGDKTFKAVFNSSPVCYNQLNTDGLPELHWPLEGAQADYKWYQNRWDYDWGFSACGGQNLRHIGLDISTIVAGETVGKTVRAAYGGIVKLIYKAGRGWGTGMVLEHIDMNGGKFTTTYIHVNPTIKQGSTPAKGDPIATIASISDPHLHFSIRRAPDGPNAQAGALPVVDQNNCTCKYKSGGTLYTRPLWPEYFIDPSQIAYTTE